MYSSIEIKDRTKVVDKCYWPLLKLEEANEIPIGIELSGYTLEKKLNLRMKIKDCP